MKEVKLTYVPGQKVYVAEFDKRLNRYKVYEQIIRHVDVCFGEIKYYTSSDRFTRSRIRDDICISESWKMLRSQIQIVGSVYYTRHKSPEHEHNPECIRGKVFSNKREAKKYQSKMNKTIVQNYDELPIFQKIVL